MELALILCAAHMIWLTAILLLNNEGPIVVVISGSMEPHFYRGDVLFTSNIDRTYKVGDIIAFRISNREIPIVHRIYQIDYDEDGKQKILTQGDNNMVDDRGLYPYDKSYLTEKEIIGKPLL